MKKALEERTLLARFLDYYHKNGVLRTFRRLWEQPYRAVFKGYTLLYYAELNEVDSSTLTLSKNITVQCMHRYEDVFRPDMQTMVNYWENECETSRVRERFEQGAALWVIWVEKSIAGFGWSIRGGMVHPFYLPLTPYDAVLFSYEIFKEYRGRGLYTLLLNSILCELKLEGVNRAFGFVFAWNTAGIRGIEKSHLRKFCQARKLHLLGRNVTVWS